MKRPPIFLRSAVLLLALCLLLPTAHAQRQMEKLGRGVIALKSSSTQVYVGWRLLGNDPEDVAFNLYRSANGGAAVKINTANGGAALTATTDYTDTPGNLSTTAYTYSVRPVVGGTEVPDGWAHPQSAGFTLPANAPTRQYVPIPLQPTPDGALDVKMCWVGDLDGNGEYDFVVDRQSADGFRQFLEAYKRDGTFLWRMDMGPNSTNHYNIEPGSSAISIGHGDNVTVYDLDGDGLAEVLVRTANGVVFGNGVTLTAANNSTQFLSVVNGLTGAEMARATVPNPYLSDGPMNGHMAVFYPDGQRPSVLLAAKNRRADSGFQGLTTVWDYRNGTLTQRWSYDADTLNQHAPEGHQIRLGDVDNDGKDEFVDIGYTIDDNGLQLHNTPEIVHGDRFHMTDIDPDRPGMETYLIQQNNGTGLATALLDPATGAFLKKWYAAGVVDVGRGLAADIDPAQKGLELFSTQGGIFNAKGVQIYADRPFPPEAIWWDGNLSRELLATVGSTAESPAIARFDAANPANQSRIYTIYNETAPGVYWAYGGRPQFTGDILGDWREEIIVAANDNSELRIYTTKNTAANRLYTLMHNAQYRIQATTKGYVQSSYVDYYLGDGMTPPQPPPMVDAQLVWRGGAGATTWNAGVTPSWLSGGANSTFADGNTVRFDIGGNNTTTVTLDGALLPGAVTVWSPKSYVFNGTNGSLGGAMKLVKAGAGALTVSGPHGFTGKTTVWDGALVLNGTLAGSAVTVWGGTFGGVGAAGLQGGRIGGTGTFSQPVVVKYRGAITPGTGMGNAGTLSFGAGLTAEDGAVMALDLSNDPSGTTTPGDRIAVTGNLVLTGKVNLFVKALSGTPAPGTYTLLTYTGTLTGSLSNLAVTAPAGVPYTLAAGGGALTLTVPVTPPPGAVVWRGSGAAWDLAASQNWLRGGTADVFVAGDAVTFDATGAAAPTVTLVTVLPVASVTVNAATDYTFGGTGSLSGAGALAKSGAGTLTVNTTNDYTGPTTVTGGVLAVANLANAGSPSSLGAASASAGNLVLNGGTLRLSGAQTSTDRSLTLGASGGTLDIASAGSSMQISGTLTGGGSLTKSGPGTILLASANNYAGGTVINGGNIYLAGSNANENGLGNGNVTINSGTLTMADVQSNDVSAWNLIVPVGATARLNADGRCGLTGSLTGGGDFTFYTGFIRTDLQGNWSAFTGRIFAVTDGDGGDLRITNANGYANAALHLGNEVYAHYNLTGTATSDLGELSGTTTSALAGGISSGSTMTWRIGAKNTNSTFSGVIVNRSGPTAINKVGTGALTLAPSTSYGIPTATVAGSTTATIISTADDPFSTAGLRAFMPVTGSGIAPGASIAAVVDGLTLTLSQPATATGTATISYYETSTYTGATTVSAGTLLVNTVITSSAITVASGAALGGTGTLRGNVTVNSGGGLAFTVTNGVVTGLNFLGNLTLNGSVFIRANLVSGGLTNGTYTIANYTGAYAGTPIFVWSPPPGSTQTATFDTATPGVIKIIVAAGGAQSLVWSGAVNTTWDAATANWMSAGTPTNFDGGDSVLLDDTATMTTVAIAGPVSPAVLHFDHTAKNYGLSGTAGGLAGTVGLAKSGTGKLTLYSANTHSGPTTISGGIVALGNDSSTTAGQRQDGGATGAGAATGSLGSGPVFVNATGQLRFGGRGGGTVYTFISANAVTMDGGTLVSYDGQQKFTGGLAIGSGGATWLTAWGGKNFWLSSALTGSGNITIDDLSVGSSDTGSALVRIDTAGNPYNGAITLNGPSAGYHGGRLQIENSTALLSATIITNNPSGLLFTATTPQLGAIGGTGNFILPATSLTVGGNGASTIYTGALSGSGALIKTGGGTFTLAGMSNIGGGTTVSGGILKITGSLTGTTALAVAAGAALEMSGGTLSVAGPITNNGTVRLYGTAALSSTGSFTNHGVLDLINGPQSLPANFVNNGLVLDSTSLRTTSASKAGNTVTLTAPTYPGHTYQLQRSATLSSPTWINVAGQSVNGDGTAHVFTDSAATGGQLFYRLLVTP